MWTTIRYILLTALRDRLFLGLCAAMLVAALVAVTLGGTAFLEEKAMALVLTAGASRGILITGLIVFVCFHIRSAFDAKDIEVMLSRPISREGLLLAFGAGFWMAGALLTVPVLAILALLHPGHWGGYAAWAASLLLEMAMIVAMALFAACTLRSAVTSVMGCLGFYLLSRMMAFFIMTSQSVMAAGKEWSAPLKELLWLISILAPRLDMFTKSEWLVYGAQMQEWWLVALQAAIYTPLLLCAAMLDFRRREF